ncbi:MAG TPA: carbon monoxide dehydrogenase subunit G [Acidocella sp.]|jgi:carbon monoxide dehydrogenase subunit G|nr:MAG: carbon monoxide dehydrogenase [Acidocella sp. 20-58-15]OYY05034.1 MAG: carbon monoxide dehydrogenase [Acidocella sp. 35-58-6]HQT38602.1 carbon monoxide dehydrogenase subunit G [Acidocella sp.]
MDMSGERLIAAPRDKVWDALNNPAILKDCIPGCESLEKLSDTQMKATAAVKLGPIAARFTGNVLLSDLDPPNGYTISGEGQGGVAGFAKGGATVKLTDEDGGTRLSYVVNAQIGGKMAQLGARLIDSTAKQMAEAFFTKFSAILAPEPVMAETAESPYHKLAEDHDHDPSNPHYFGLPLGVIIAAIIATIAVGLTVFKYL